jgi:hypothetical protein
MHTTQRAERARLAAADDEGAPWRQWGPYLSERAWGTVREDYSEFSTPWEYFPHDHARSRAYRWSEDGLGGISDDQQRFCFAFAFWNGKDPIIKERVFGLGGNEGNHGEDAKDYWWYVDSTPTHSYMRWRYHYPQAEFPYRELHDANWLNSRDEPEVELLDTGAFAGDRYWAITAEYAKAGPHDMAMVLTLANMGPDEATLVVMPTLWFRNTWAWESPSPEPPVIRADAPRLIADHAELGRIVLSGDGEPDALACDNESNAERLWRTRGHSPYPKDGINDHVVVGAATVNPAGTGTKAALRYTVTVPGGGSAQIRLRLAADDGAGASDFGEGFAGVMAQRAAEADEFFADLTPAGTDPGDAAVARSAIAGLLWSKQFYHYDVARWMTGDPSEASPSGNHCGRNARWTHMRCHDLILMPDAWEYPWFAAWDLAFHSVSIARVDPAFAKSQLLLLVDERYQHPDGQIPGYEWAFDNANPPLHAWAALKVFARDGSRDFDFLGRMLERLLREFAWWTEFVAVGDVFGGGFLGLDNIGPFDRSLPVPDGSILEQSDGTAWMAMYAIHLAEIARICATRSPAYADFAATLISRFASITGAAYDRGLWDEQDGFFYDVLRRPDGTSTPLKVRSVAGVLPLCAVGVLDTPQGRRPLAMLDAERLRRVLSRVLDEREFLSPNGIRSLSKAHLAEPFSVTLDGHDFIIGYEPGESRSPTFGGNSNWRGPVWFPVNVMLIDALRTYHRIYGKDLTVEHPTGSGNKRNLGEIADDLSERLIGLFRPDAADRRRSFGNVPAMRDDPRWGGNPLFYEYFHGDTGAGLGAEHQTGWTALVVDLILDGENR